MGPSSIIHVRRPATSFVASITPTQFLLTPRLRSAVSCILHDPYQDLSRHSFRLFAVTITTDLAAISHNFHYLSPSERHPFVQPPAPSLKRVDLHCSPASATIIRPSNGRHAEL